jgi:hypothetical protein
VSIDSDDRRHALAQTRVRWQSTADFERIGSSCFEQFYPWHARKRRVVVAVYEKVVTPGLCGWERNDIGINRNNSLLIDETSVLVIHGRPFN